MGNNPGIQSHNTQGTPPYPTGRSTLQARGKLALLVPLLALAILLLVPAVVFARDDLPAPQSLTATSGDGDMTLNWNNATNADAGYEYRYSSYSLGLSLTDLDPEYTCPTAPPGAPAECKWLGATTSAGATRSLAGNPDSPQAVVFLTSIIDELVSIATYYVHYHVISDWNTSVLRSTKPGKWLSGQTSSETITGLTVGTTYFFQVRSKHADHDGKGIKYSGHSNPATAIQRATPAAIDDLAAEPGNGEVTLTWTHLSDYNIVNYEVNRSSGGVRTGYQTTADYKVSLLDGTATHTVTELVNGTTYSFLVRGTNLIGVVPNIETKTGPDGAFVTATPLGPLAAPASLTAQQTSAAGTEVRLN